jgi:hypothetical protein
MRLKFETVLSTLGVLTAVAYVLGWLQAFYYFDTFGIRLASVEMSPQDYLLNSWFVIENVVFFVILIWVIVNRPRWWSVTIGVGYFLIPIAAHYSFFAPDWRAAQFLIDYRHTLLKFIPFVVLGGVVLFDWLRGSPAPGTVIQLSWAHSKGMFVLVVIIVGAWSVSVAKHFGSFDANLELRHPERMLASVRLHTAPEVGLPEALTSSAALYLVHATATQLFIWDSAGFTFGQRDQSVTIYVIARDKIQWFETTKSLQIQRGSFIF